jgi:hypothetical protein
MEKKKKATPKKAPKKKESRATIMQRKAMKIALENGGNVSGAMREAGYSPAVAKNPHKLKESPGWQELMKKAGLDDNSLLKNHKELMDQKKMEYFVFPTAMKDDEIKSHVEAAGLKVVVIRKAQIGKMAFYSIPDAHAKKSALEMAYRLRGAFGEGGNNTIVPIQINNMLGSKREEYGI